MNDKFDLHDMIYGIATDSSENETRDLSENDTTTPGIVPSSVTASFLPTPTASPMTLAGVNSRDEYQYYIIGVYSFFAVLFAIGIIMIVARKLQEACCSSETDYDDYDSVPRRDSLDSQSNPGFEHHVNVDPLDVERTYQRHNSDYDYYSDASDGEPTSLKDRPPDYEEPPSYSIVLQT